MTCQHFRDAQQDILATRHARDGALGSGLSRAARVDVLLRIRGGGHVQGFLAPRRAADKRGLRPRADSIPERRALAAGDGAAEGVRAAAGGG